MNLLGQILLVCLIIAALQGLVTVLAIAIVFFLLWGLVCRTEQTVGLLIVLGLMAALQAHPWITIGAGLVIFGLLLIAGKLAPDKPVEPTPIALPAPDEQAD